MPVEKEKTFLCHAKALFLVNENNRKSIQKDILIYIHKDSLSENLSAGGQLFIQAQVRPPRNNGNPNEFDYAGYLKRQGICGITYLKASDWRLLEKQASVGLKQQALLYRTKLLSVYETLNLQPDEKAILSGLIFGYKQELSPELKNSFSVTGASHVLSVSGLHVGIIYMITSFLLFPIGRNNNRIRIAKEFLIVLLLWCLAFITELSPPVVRAVSMFTLASVAIAINRKASIFNTICVSAFIMLLYNPFYLFDVGFQLSYSAVIAIVLLQPHLQQILPLKNRILKSIWSLLTVSVAAQLGTFPFVVYYFNQFPNYFLLTNLLVIPLTYLITLFAMLSLVLQSAVGNCWFIKDVLAFFLKCMHQSISSIESMPYSSTRNININEIEVIMLFLLIIAGFSFWMKNRFNTLITILTCLSILITIRFVKNQQTANQSYITFFYQRTTPAVNIISGKNNFVVTNDMQSMSYAAKNEWLKKNATEPFLLTFPFFHKELFFNDSFIVYKNKRIFILMDNAYLNQQAINPLRVDYLLIGKDFSGKIEQTLLRFNPQQVVLDASLPAYISRRLHQECLEQHIVCHDIAQQGALQVFCKSIEN